LKKKVITDILYCLFDTISSKTTYYFIVQSYAVIRRMRRQLNYFPSD